MHHDNIRKESEQLIKRLALIQKELSELQSNCPHANVIITSGSNTSDYDSSLKPLYWIDNYCEDCQKHWREYQ